MIAIFIAGIMFIYARPSCWFILHYYVFLLPILMMCLFLSVICSLLPTMPSVDTLIYQSIKWFWYWNLGYMGLCFYVPVCTINDYLPPIQTSYQSFYPALIMCFFLSVNATVCRCVCPLIDYNIDINSWDFWDCVLSVIGPVRPIDFYFTYVVSMLPFCKCPLMKMIPSVDILLYR